jgi:hypothetical protein
MSYSEKEIEKQESEIRKKIFLVFIPIIIMVIIIGYFQLNSISHNKEKYENNRKIEFNGKVIKKRQEGEFTRAARFLILDNYYEQRVENWIYNKISLGDSVYKKTESDSIFFMLKNGEIIIEDYNKHLREKYLDLLRE